MNIFTIIRLVNKFTKKLLGGIMLRIKRLIKKIILVFRLDRLAIFFLSLFSHNRIIIDEKTARSTLEEFSPFPKGRCFCENRIDDPEYDLQIIIPAYNVEEYLEECLNSVAEQQTRFSYKVVVIDDGSSDRTGDIADKYRHYPNFEIIHQENRGFSGARNRGLEHISARYVAFVDSDDKLCDGAVEALLSCAFRENADIVQGGYVRLVGDRIFPGAMYESRRGPSSNNGLNGFPWGKVFKSEIFKNVKLPEGFWFEDIIFSFLIYPQDYLSVTVPDIAFVYRNNPRGITNTAKKYPKCIDSYWALEMVLAECRERGFELNELYYKKVLGQILLTYKRTALMPTEIKKAIFELSCCLVERNFPENSKPPVHKMLDKALRKKDFGAYLTYCKYKMR